MKIILLILLVCQLNVIKEDVLLVVARGDDDSFTGNIFAYINNNNIYINLSIRLVIMSYQITAVRRNLDG